MGRSSVFVFGGMMSEPISFGRHRGNWDGEFLTLSLDGEISESEAIAMLDLMRVFESRVGNFGMMLLLHGSFGITPEARRTVAKRSNPDRPALPLAVVGTSTVTRALFTLLLNAIRLTTKLDVPVRFCATETEAKRWLSEQVIVRAKLLQNRQQQ